MSDLTNVAYDYLFAKICSGELPPNAPIVEQEISSALSISRTPVREALQALESDGLVSHIRFRGTFVRELSLQDINEIYELRRIFEMSSLKSAMANITDDEISRLYDNLCAINEDSPLEDFYATDRELHEIILRYSYNSRMVQFYNQISAQVEHIRRLSSSAPKRMMKSRSEHMRIIEAIKSGDEQWAEQCLGMHLDNVHKSAIDVILQMRTGIRA